MKNKSYFIIIGAIGGYIATTFDTVWREALKDSTIGAFPIGSIIFVTIIAGFRFLELKSNPDKK